MKQIEITCKGKIREKNVIVIIIIIKACCG